MSYDVKIFNSLDELSKQFSELLKREVNSKDKKFNLVLSGGSTPREIFNYLYVNYKDQINWSNINFFWGDERCVPPNDVQSNFKMANDTLLDKLKIPTSNIFRIKGENDPAIEAHNYSLEIIHHIKSENYCPKFDLIMLGLGEDGHIASIFPNQKSLLNSDKVYSTSVHPITGQTRITLTGRVINNASNIVFIATGKNKSKVVDEILNNKIESENYPASFILPTSGKLIWMLDNEAASLLKGY